MSNESSSLSLIEGNFKCYLCDELYIYPVTLPCRHTVCKQCLDKHFDNNGFTCPFCRTRVSNWLRRIKLNNSNIVDTKFWNIIKLKFSTDIEARLAGITDVEVHLLETGENDQFDINVVIRNENTREHILNCHEQIKNISLDELEPWRGWPQNSSTACRDVACTIASNIDKTSQCERPRLNISQPGEIRQEYEEFLCREKEENSKQEQKNLMLSQALIKMIEEDEAREREEQQKQLKADEELAKCLAEELYQPRETLTNDSSDSQNVNKVRDSPSARSKFDTSPTVSPSTSTDNVFFRNRSRTKANRKQILSSQSKLSEKTPTPTKRVGVAQVPSTFSTPGLSHFNSVVPQPSTSNNVPLDEQMSMSRSSSGSDSIGQELCHFKPIRTSPTTPTKDGDSSWVRKVVLPQRGVTNSEVIDLICGDPDSDISVNDIEESLALEKQIEADRELAAMLQEEYDASENKRKRSGIYVRTDYNLRNKKKKSNLRKKVLVDRAQATLDTMLIK